MTGLIHTVPALYTPIGRWPSCIKSDSMPEEKRVPEECHNPRVGSPSTRDDSDIVHALEMGGGGVDRSFKATSGLWD